MILMLLQSFLTISAELSRQVAINRGVSRLLGEIVDWAITRSVIVRRHELP